MQTAPSWACQEAAAAEEEEEEEALFKGGEEATAATAPLSHHQGPGTERIGGDGVEVEENEEGEEGETGGTGVEEREVANENGHGATSQG